MIHTQKVLLNGKPVKASKKALRGERFSIEMPVDEPTELVPFDLDLDIYFEDEHLLVINKPAGLVVHPAAGHSNDTLVNALVFHKKTLANNEDLLRPGIVHRLDKETSGLLVVAKTSLSLSHLCQQFREKTVHRIYSALVYDSFETNSGTIKSFLKRHPVHRKRYASEKLLSYQDPTGKRAVTHYKQLAHSPLNVSLVECQLETGRTHQIRVHMSEAKHPIIGDSLYSSSRKLKSLNSPKLIEQVRNLPRIGLHARELGFIHPVNQKVLHFKAPWPEDLKPILKTLGMS